MGVFVHEVRVRYLSMAAQNEIGSDVAAADPKVTGGIVSEMLCTVYPHDIAVHVNRLELKAL